MVLQNSLTSKDTVQLRLVKVILPSGEIEIIATNLFDSKKYASGIFKELYFLRWGIEVEYGAHKNIYQLEIQSGYSINTIKQDFYTTVFIANLHNIFMKIETDKGHGCKCRLTKYNYKINRNVTSAVLRNQLIDIILNTERDSSSIVNDIESIFSKYKEPIRPNRRVERRNLVIKMKGKYRSVTNFKRAV